MIAEIFETASEIPTDVPVICVDLDGTLIQYDTWKGADHFGEPLPGSQKFLEDLQSIGHVVIYTTRTNAAVADEDPNVLADKIRLFLDNNELPYNDVYAGEGKPLAAVYIDDRSVECKPQEGDSEGEYELVVNQVKQEIDKQHGED